jgi:hypothetical protein
MFAAQSARCLKAPFLTINSATTVNVLSSSSSKISPRTVHLMRLSKVSTPSPTPPLLFTISQPTPMVCPVFLRIAIRFGAQAQECRSYHSCRAGDHINLELRSKTRKHTETCNHHLFRCGCSRRRHGAACFQRKQLE